MGEPNVRTLAVSHHVLEFEACSARPASTVLRNLTVLRWTSKFIVTCLGCVSTERGDFMYINDHFTVIAMGCRPEVLTLVGSHAQLQALQGAQ